MSDKTGKEEPSMDSDILAEAPPTRKDRASLKIDMRQVLPAIFVVVSVVWIVLGVNEFGFWNPLRGGTPAFLPICIASVLLVSSLIMFLISFKEEKPSYTPLCFLYLLLCLAIVGLSLAIGFIPSSLLFVLLWLKVIEKAPWKTTFLVVACLAAIGYGIFELWLDVPFPKGVLVELVL